MPMRRSSCERDTQGDASGEVGSGAYAQKAAKRRKKTPWQRCVLENLNQGVRVARMTPHLRDRQRTEFSQRYPNENALTELAVRSSLSGRFCDAGCNTTPHNDLRPPDVQLNAVYKYKALWLRAGTTRPLKGAQHPVVPLHTPTTRNRSMRPDRGRYASRSVCAQRRQSLDGTQNEAR
jgi:hypothetical protein